MNENRQIVTDGLKTWVAPRLLRLDQADGTDKHILYVGESLPGAGPTCAGAPYDTGTGAGGTCFGPS